MRSIHKILCAARGALRKIPETATFVNYGEKGGHRASKIVKIACAPCRRSEEVRAGEMPKRQNHHTKILRGGAEFSLWEAGAFEGPGLPKKIRRTPRGPHARP